MLLFSREFSVIMRKNLENFRNSWTKRPAKRLLTTVINMIGQFLDRAMEIVAFGTRRLNWQSDFNSFFTLQRYLLGTISCIQA